MTLLSILPALLGVVLQAHDATRVVADQGMSASHFVYIPLSVIVGLVIGFILGLRLGRAETRRQQASPDAADAEP